MRIVSLVPSLTELLFDLGLDEEVVGITKFCIHPEPWFRTKKRVGGTKQLHLDIIQNLSPDLIIANKEENTREQIEALQNEYKVLLTDIHTLPQSLEAIQDIGLAVNRLNAADELCVRINKAIQTCANQSSYQKVLYIIWNDPIMAAGNDTFIHAMLDAAGWQNIINSSRYPVLEETHIHELQPDLIFLSSEPFPFAEKHQQAWQEKFPKSKVVLVDGEFFSWYGSRMLQAFPYFSRLHASLT
jgi:ABC-type Fe3+-hydroxamate transport system substrate-binding protein